MYKTKVIAVVGTFILVAAMKFFAPAAVLEVKEIVTADTDYRAVFTELGNRVAGSGEEIAVVLGISKEAEPEVIPSPMPEQTEKVREKKVNAIMIPTLEELRGKVKEKIPSAAAYLEIIKEREEAKLQMESAYADAVSVFLSSQESFSDYEVPANVSYTAEILPFEYDIPVSGKASSGFGYRIHPITHTVKYHYGTDIAVGSGTEILAFADGIVAVSAFEKGYGNYVVIEHEDGYKTLYAHCAKLLVSAGDIVEKGQAVATVGSTGQTTGPHLHFELMYNDVYLNPEFYINSYGGL